MIAQETHVVGEHDAALVTFNAGEFQRVQVSIEFLRHGLEVEDAAVSPPKRLRDSQRLIDEVLIGGYQADVRRDHEHLAQR
ncbi:MAG: hypothetical protein ACYDHT_05115 [Solirubrobacteraceae bacterium]